MVPYQHLTDFPSTYKEMILEAYVTRVCDGDGFDFIHIPKFHFHAMPNTPNELKARLAGIDAPEGNKSNSKKQPLADESREYLEYLILNKRVTLKVLSIDKYYRALVIVFADGINVNLEMVKAGYACIYREHNAYYDKYYHLFNNAEIFAKKRLNGIWQFESVELPVEYKKRMCKDQKIVSQ